MGALLCKGKKGHMKVNTDPTEEDEEDDEEEYRGVHTYSAENQKKSDQLTLQNEQAKAREQGSSLNPVEGNQAAQTAQSSSAKTSDGS